MAEGNPTAASKARPRERALFSAAGPRDPTETRFVCRFLARERDDGFPEAPTGLVDSANRCVALGQQVAQSGQQQELVCLTAAHTNCPRYLRGLLLADAPLPPPRREPTSPAVIGAVLVLAAALAASFGFLAVRGGFSVPLGSGSPAPVVVAAGPSPLVGPSVAPVPSAPPTAVPSPPVLPSPTASPPPTLTPTPAPTPTPTPRRTATPAPSSDRYALLTKCPSRSNCWTYVIRSGDNLRSIANWFGVSYDRMLAMNPSLRTPIHAGDQLRIPTPTR